CPRSAVGQTHEPRFSGTGDFYLGQEYGHQLGDCSRRRVREFHFQFELVRYVIDPRPLRLQRRAYTRPERHLGCPGAEIVLRSRTLSGGWMGTWIELHRERRRAFHFDMGDWERPGEHT